MAATHGERSQRSRALQPAVRHVPWSLTPRGQAWYRWLIMLIVIIIIGLVAALAEEWSVTRAELALRSTRGAGLHHRRQP